MAAHRVSKSSLLFVGFVLVIAALLVAVVVFDRSAGVDYTLTFQDSKGLRAGAPATLDGVPIGEVTDVRLGEAPGAGVEVDVRIYPEHRNRVYAPPNTTGYIKKPMVMGDSTLEIVNRGEGGEPLADGARIEGVETRVSLMAWEARAAAGEAWATAVEQSQEQLAKLETWANSPENQARREEVMAFIEDFETSVREKGVESAGTLRAAITRGQNLLHEIRAEAQPELEADLNAAMQILEGTKPEGLEEAAPPTPVPGLEAPPEDAPVEPEAVQEQPAAP